MKFMSSKQKQILLTNDDGIGSPGLWAAAEVLSELGYVTVAAPREHSSATGRSFPKHSDGKITSQKMEVNGQSWEVYAVGGTPSQTTLHALLEILPQKPDLVVAGINYGENLSCDITFSGTVGGAMEAASLGIPAMATSLQILKEDWDTYHKDVDFSTAAYFTKYFAKLLLEKHMLPDVDLFNLCIPVNATPQTPWRLTCLAKTRYFNPYVIRSGAGTWQDEGYITSHANVPPDLPSNTDVHTLINETLVSLTPLSLDLTSRVDFQELNKLLRE